MKNKAAILLSGGYGTGKSYTANMIKDKVLAQSSVIIPLADVLRKELSAIYNIPDDRLWEKPTPQWVRFLFLKYSQKQKSFHGESYFADNVLHNFKSSGADVLIVDDLRFEIEYKTIKKEIENTIVIFLGDVTSQYELNKIYEYSNFIIHDKPSLRDLQYGLGFFDDIFTLRWYNQN